MSKSKKKSVYIIHNRKANMIKIGVSSNTEERCNTLINSSGMPLSIKYNSKPVSDYFMIEALMHSLFCDKRGFGEWFHCSYEVPIIRLKSLIKYRNNCLIVKKYNEGKTLYEISYEMRVSETGIKQYLIGKGYFKTNRSKFIEFRK